MNGPDRAMPTTPQGIARDLTLQVLSWGVQPQHLRPRLPDREDLERACLLEAIALREAGDPQRSLELIEQALEHGLNDPWLLDNRARALRDLGQWQEPMRIWSELAQQHSDAALAQVASQMLADADLGHSCLHDVVAHLEAGDPQRSLELIEQALEHGLNDPWLLDNRARALLALGLPEPALEIWSELVSHSDPAVAAEASRMLAHSDLRYPCLQEVIARREAGDPQGSLDLIGRFEALGLNDPWLLDNRARALLAQGQHQAALEIWTQLSAPRDGEGDGHAGGDGACSQVARQMVEQLAHQLLEPLMEACARWSWSPQHLVLGANQLLEQRPSPAPINGVLREIVACREAGLAELSLNLATIAQEQGWRSPWLQDNAARALVNLGRKAEALEIWRELASRATDAAVAATATEMLGVMETEQAQAHLHSQLEQLQREGRHDEAVTLLVEHWRRQPDGPQPLGQIAVLLAEAESSGRVTINAGASCAALDRELAEERCTLAALRRLQQALQPG